MGPHLAYMSTSVLPQKTLSIDPDLIIKEWNCFPSENKPKLDEAFKTLAKVAWSGLALALCMLLNNLRPCS